MIFFQDSLMNKNLKNNNLYLKQYTFVTIYTTVQKRGQCFFVLFVFLKEISFYSARIC